MTTELLIGYGIRLIMLFTMRLLIGYENERISSERQVILGLGIFRKVLGNAGVLECVLCPG